MKKLIQEAKLEFANQGQTAVWHQTLVDNCTKQSNRILENGRGIALEAFEY